jgi:HTH-type transcriptional regulator / antitoxin HigA
MMASTQTFRPNWASAPGDTIVDVLKQQGLSVIEFGHRIGQTTEGAMDLIQGRTAITIAVARQLALVLGASVEFWMSRDFQYREDIARLDSEWLGGLPIDDMVSFGWLKPVPDQSQRIATVLEFFNASSVGTLRETYATMQEMIAFRTSPAFESQPAAVAAWLRQGEIEAQAINCSPWDPKGFQVCLTRIRSLTRNKDPKRFLPVLKKLCAEAGVAIVVVRAPAGCRASGATRFLSRDKALLMLSFRYLTDDQFWFTFFHEAGHLLLHGERGFFLEGAETSSTKEEEDANQFAAGILIPSESQQALLGLPLDAREVVRFAVRLGVSPGIVVGQLQHSKTIRQNQLNRLKRHFRWADEDLQFRDGTA